MEEWLIYSLANTRHFPEPESIRVTVHTPTASTPKLKRKRGTTGLEAKMTLVNMRHDPLGHTDNTWNRLLLRRRTGPSCQVTLPLTVGRRTLRHSTPCTRPLARLTSLSSARNETHGGTFFNNESRVASRTKCPNGDGCSKKRETQTSVARPMDISQKNCTRRVLPKTERIDHVSSTPHCDV